MIKEIFALEGYVTQETNQGSEALRLLHAAEDGMIVYLEPLVLQMQGNERLYDFIMDRGLHNPHIFILLASSANLQVAMPALRADGYLAIPFTAHQLVTSVEHAQRLLQAKRAKQA
jgi:DNA-binding NtrC family response regulator